ncbi:MAG: phosphoribosylglycinamide formyltransferase [Alphaproteobacteria bacterium]|nr:phosphoribosylglycinamide formyltransferase [Alphaproteobacteria bacterium]
MTNGADTQPRKRVAVLISGRGSNMMSLVEASRALAYPAEIVTVISNRPAAPGLAWARAQGIETVALDHKAYPSRAAFDDALDAAIKATGADIVACAGFMRLMTKELVERWHNRMINIHPTLLPSFKGLDTHARALATGVRIAGCTVHIVRAEMDAGPILGQAAVPVLDADTPDTLARRILTAEHRLYPQVLSLFAAGAYDIHQDTARLKGASTNDAMLFSPPS